MSFVYLTPIPPTDATGPNSWTYDDWLVSIYQSGLPGITARITWHHWSAFCAGWVGVAWAMLVGDE